MRPLTGAQIARAATLACLIEAGVEKPGNVSPAAAFADTTYEDFVVSARAIGPAFAAAGDAGVGETVLRAVQATRQAVGTNTNLGIALLLAPPAKAAAGAGAAQGLRRAVARVLAGLTTEDAHLAYEAIRLASPGGMGRVDRHDVGEEEVAATLLEAMRAARERDAVAREYVTDYEITFTVGVPALRQVWAGGRDRRGGMRPDAGALKDAVLHCFLTVLATVPDTLIARKRGLATARSVSARAAEVLGACGATERGGARELAAFDAELRDPGHTLNPGTTADLVAAALFVWLVQGGMSGRVVEAAGGLDAGPAAATGGLIARAAELADPDGGDEA